MAGDSAPLGRNSVLKDSDSSSSGIWIMNATARAQRTAAALVAAQNGQKGTGVSNPSSTSIISPVAPTSVVESPKTTRILASKAGINFVIPKNKLSGALVPIRKGGGKRDPSEPKKEEAKQLRKTKWGLDPNEDSVVKRGRALALQTRVEQIAAQLESGSLDLVGNKEARSPSSPPLHDNNGHRVNTREVRRHEELDMERCEAIEECLRLNPLYKPPPGYKPAYKEAKLFIPVKDYPGYDFIGLILGPSGQTQKQIELETGTKITIRGKGTIKEGKPHNLPQDGKDLEGAFEEEHVYIQGETWEKVDAAIALIEPLLNPVDEEKNVHKPQNSRELEELNGTDRDFLSSCTSCGEIGHREWQCLKARSTSSQDKAQCQHCGDVNHASIECLTDLSAKGRVLEEGLEEATHGHSRPMLLTSGGPRLPSLSEQISVRPPLMQPMFYPRFVGPTPPSFGPVPPRFMPPGTRLPPMRGQPFPRMSWAPPGLPPRAPPAPQLRQVHSPLVSQSNFRPLPVSNVAAPQQVIMQSNQETQARAVVMVDPRHNVPNSFTLIRPVPPFCPLNASISHSSSMPPPSPVSGPPFNPPTVISLPMRPPALPLSAAQVPNMRYRQPSPPMPTPPPLPPPPQLQFPSISYTPISNPRPLILSSGAENSFQMPPPSSWPNFPAAITHTPIGHPQSDPTNPSQIQIQSQTHSHPPPQGQFPWSPPIPPPTNLLGFRMPPPLPPMQPRFMPIPPPSLFPSPTAGNSVANTPQMPQGMTQFLGSQPPRPPPQQVDPEYEELMASVGVV